MYFGFEINTPQIEADGVALYVVVQRNTDHAFVNRMEIVLPDYRRYLDMIYRTIIVKHVNAAKQEAGLGCDMDEVTHTEEFAAALDADIAIIHAALDEVGIA